jgi:hypothetical protein
MTSPLTGWLPGVLSDNQIKILCHEGWVEGVSDEKQIDPSAVNLTLSDEG